MINNYTRFIFIAAVVLSLSTGASAQASNDTPSSEPSSGAVGATAPLPSSDEVLLSPYKSAEETSEPKKNDQKDPIEARANVGLVIGPKFGANFSQVFGDLGTSFIGELEIGYLLPFLQRSIEVFVTGQYTQPPIDGKTSKADARLPGDGIMHYDIIQQQVILTLGALYRIPIGGNVGQWLRPYAALGGRLYMMRTLIKGKAAGEDFGENKETATKGGFYGALGGDAFVGPGSAFLEVQVVYASLDGFVMRDTNVGALNLAVGYRFFL
jgi:hypothetical protein